VHQPSRTKRSSSKSVFGFILTEEEADLWFQMIVDRNLTSHAYDEELSERIYANILSKYAALLESASQRLQGLEWD
jgi:hypothetical protein